MDKCSHCGGLIPKGETVKRSGLTYHVRCWKMDCVAKKIAPYPVGPIKPAASISIKLDG